MTTSSIDDDTIVLTTDDTIYEGCGDDQDAPTDPLDIIVTIDIVE
jgi:hypothetical protein